MKIEPVRLSSIDTEDAGFLTRSREGADFITESIRRIGLISPPVLTRAGDKFRIETGWKRVLVCADLGYGEILGI